MLAALGVERVRLERLRGKIPLRICVTGTRGKSTVTRLVASILRESGLRVVAKTTGSKPVIILPDGTEREVRRLGPPSVLEQKKILAAAARLGADAVVAEMMSLRPECLAVESDRIFRPGLLLITNVREDHQEEMGSTKAEIAASLAAAIPEGGTVLVPEEEIYPVFRKAADARKAELRPVAAVSESLDVGSPGGGDVLGFSENRRLALAAAEALGLDRVAASGGIAQARPDFGGLAVFRSASPVTGAAWFLVNAFAANEPESSARSLSLLERRFPALPKRRIALLALRADRGARTVQWIKAARSGFFSGFSALVFIGDHARAMARSRRRGFSGIETAALSERRPEEIMRRLGRIESGEAQIVGLGNIVGVGAALVEYWMKTGERAS